MKPCALGEIMTEPKANVWFDASDAEDTGARGQGLALDRRSRMMYDADHVFINGESYRVVGVMDDSFAFPNTKAQLWVPFAFTPKQKSDDERGHEFSESVGRLKPGATIAELNAQLDAITHANVERIAAASAEGVGLKKFIESSGFTGRAKNLHTHLVGELAPVLLLLQAVVAFVLLIACANVANLMLTRISARQKELSVRTALGAGRGRLARQLLVESLMLALAGGIAGLVVAQWCVQPPDNTGSTLSELRMASKDSSVRRRLDFYSPEMCVDYCREVEPYSALVITETLRSE